MITPLKIRPLLSHPLTAAFIGALGAILLIYLTPLKQYNLIEPKIRDVAASIIHQEMSKNPEGYIFLDVRPEGPYRISHAAGSINVPLHTLYTERHVLPKKGKKIVLICSGGVASGVAYSYLEHYGFRNIVRVEGGIEKWAADGLPLEQGS